MRFLLGLLVVWSVVGVGVQPEMFANVLRPPSLVRAQGLSLQTFKHVAELQREVDMLVARGYMLFTGEFHTEASDRVTGNEFLLIRDLRSPIYRYSEEKLAIDGGASSFTAKGIAAGGQAPLGGDGKDVNVQNFIYIPRNSTDTELSQRGWYHYRLETADGFYPETPADVETIKLITPMRTVELRPVAAYRIYRGQKALQDVVPGLFGHIIETVAINGNNPYVIYRHTQVVRRSGEKSDRLSIGVYPRIALQPHLIAEKSVIIEGADAVGSKLYEFIPNDDEEKATLNYGLVDKDSTQITLQLIQQSDIWNEYQGNAGTTGEGIEALLKRNYFNGESSD
ncbi:MAG: hypothetical protein OYH77_05845 [Pseudomonadota bacterium]|nr:hypothetical protein [Pseudomonadota bacterium]